MPVQDHGFDMLTSTSPQEDGRLIDASKRRWGTRVPYVAQAGETASGRMPSGDGFGPAKKAGMEVYVLSP